MIGEDAPFLYRLRYIDQIDASLPIGMGFCCLGFERKIAGEKWKFPFPL